MINSHNKFTYVLYNKEIPAGCLHKGCSFGGTNLSKYAIDF